MGLCGDCSASFPFPLTFPLPFTFTFTFSFPFCFLLVGWAHVLSRSSVLHGPDNGPHVRQGEMDYFNLPVL